MRRGAGRFTAACEGIAAIEFAMLLPLLLVLLFGGYAATQAISLGRKVTITTRALADLTTQFAVMSSTDMSTVMNASAQILAPFDAGVLRMRLTEITTDSTGKVPTVTWSVARNMAAYATGSTVTLPASMQKADTSYIFSETQYPYTPLTSFGMRAFTIGDTIYMLPRISTSVSYSG